MKQRYLKRKINSEAEVQFYLDKGFTQSLAEVLAARGIAENDFEFYFGNSMCFHSPYDMVNMKDAVETINYVMETGGSILICGDYDADGLTASSMLSLFFSDNGIENNVIIPTRDEGYGLHAEKVIRAFERNYYDLVITVDCGISNAEEVKKITEELGVEVIVTDHHELPDVLPDCICVNPKLGYPFPYLSGAGVAWKLIEALAGREVAIKYSDLAAIGTIGDIMPMQDENRSIIKLGLANWNHKNLNKLSALSHCSSPITCNDIAMKIVPKINAAGRVGYPDIALSFLLCRDKTDASACEKLLELNEDRKKILDEIIAEADPMCDTDVIYSEKMVFLYSDRWHHGLLGIVAARYKEKYGFPAFIMTKDGDDYVGSARGIDSLDLFEIVSACREHLTKFGGHKASVGFSVKGDRIEQFRKSLSDKLSSFDNSCFDKIAYYDVELTKECKSADVMELSNKLQPLLPQDKIICRVIDTVKFANSFGKDDAHLSATLSNGLEIKGFNKYGKYAPFIKNGAKVDLLCSLEIDGYTKKVCGVLEDLSLLNSVCFDEFYKLNFLKNFVTDNVVAEDEKEVSKLLCEKSVAVVFDDYETYLDYCKIYDLEDYCVDVFFDSNASDKTVAVSPLANYNFSRFKHVLYFTDKEKHRKLPSNTHYYAVKPSNETVYALDLTRDECIKSFKALKNKGKFDSIKSVYEKYLVGIISYEQYVVAVRVFEELGIVRIIDQFSVEFETAQKQDLANSKIFMCFNKSNKDER